MKIDDWWNYFWENDQTVLVTKNEHYKLPADQINLVPLDWQLGYFACKKMVGFDFRKSIEGAFIGKLAKKSQSGEENMITQEDLKQSLNGQTNF